MTALLTIPLLLRKVFYNQVGVTDDLGRRSKKTGLNMENDHYPRV